MISKQILPGSWFRDIPTAHLIDVHSRGFERGPLLKMAAAEELMRADIRPEHGQSLIHLITTGAQEFYGPNSNADGFNEKAADFKIPRHHATGKPAIYKMAGGLTEFHDTFLKYGAVYEEHFNSKKGGKPKGTIKMASYNPTMHRGELIVSVPNDTWAKDLNKLANGEPVYWSMGCFEAGAMVMLGSGQMVPIETITVGDVVRTHTGKNSRVESTRRLEYRDIDVYTIKPSGGAAVTCTEEHPFFVLDKDLVVKNGRCILESFKLEDGSWKAAKDLQIGDYAVTPLRRTVAEPAYVSDAFAKFCGYYLAEGYVLFDKEKKPCGVCFTAHVDDALPRNIDALCEQMQTRNPPYKEPRANSEQAVSVCVYDGDLALRMLLLFGSGATHKFIGESVLHWSDERLLCFLGAYHEGDGGYYASSDVDQTRGNAYFSTSSQELATQMQWLHACLGGPTSINNLTHTTSKSANTVSGYTTEYQLWCSRQFTKILAPWSSKISNIDCVENHGRKERFVIDGFMLTKIKGVEVETRDSVVYNMEVEDEDHSYLVNLMAVHNCGVKSDICSMCENRAATRAQYCDHLRYNKLAIDKEGNQAFAINDEPHFHDISKVAVPADRIAFALRKVASGMSFIEMEQTAEGLYIPLGLIQKIGSATEARQAYALSKLAEIEKKIALKANPEDQHLAEAFGETQVPAETLKKMAAYALEDVLDACNRRHVMLPPQAFVHIVMNKAAAIPDLSGIGAALKDVFSTASAEDDQAVVSDSSYVVQCPGKYAGLEDLAESLRPAFSIDDEPVRHRIITSVIHGGPSLSKRANMLVTPNMSAETRYLAREYAKYQVAFLAGAGADKYAHRVVVHNQVMN